MAIGDNSREGSVSSLIIESLESNRSGDSLSDEDLAWADSCLINNPEYFNNNWNSLKDALLEILDNQSESLVSSAARTGGFPGGSDMEILPSNYEAETAGFLELTDGYLPTYEEAEIKNDSSPTDKEGGKFPSDVFEGSLSKISLQNAILPNFKDGQQRVRESSDSVHNPGFSTDEIESSTEDIFRVWDFDIPAEEDEFVKQLDKALAETSSQSMPSTSDDFVALNDESIKSIDDLIAGVADLSLNKI